MFLKDNKYKDVIIAVLITFTFCIIIYKAFDILGPGITYFFKEFVSLSMPFVYGIVIAYILSPVVRIFERRLKLSNGISIALTYAVFLGIIFVLCIYGIPSLIDSIKDIASNADSYMESVRSFIDKITNNPMLKDFASTTGVVANLETYISKVGTIAVNLLESSLSGIFSVSSQIVKVILGFIVSIYVLIDKNRLIAASKKFLELFIKKEKTEKIIEFMKIYNDMIGAYIGIKALDSLIIGIMAFILLSIVNSEYAVLLYTPCISVIGTMKKEFGNKMCAFSVIYQVLLAWIASFAVYNIGSLIIYNKSYIEIFITALLLISAIFILYRSSKNNSCKNCKGSCDSCNIKLEK